jgi:hypothetical protein
MPRGVHPLQTSAMNEGSSTRIWHLDLQFFPPDDTFDHNIYSSGDAENFVEQDTEEWRREFWIDGDKESEKEWKKRRKTT